MHRGRPQHNALCSQCPVAIFSALSRFSMPFCDFQYAFATFSALLRFSLPCRDFQHPEQPWRHRALIGGCGSWWHTHSAWPGAVSVRLASGCAGHGPSSHRILRCASRHGANRHMARTRAHPGTHMPTWGREGALACVCVCVRVRVWVLDRHVQFHEPTYKACPILLEAAGLTVSAHRADCMTVPCGITGLVDLAAQAAGR